MDDPVILEQPQADPAGTTATDSGQGNQGNVGAGQAISTPPPVDDIQLPGDVPEDLKPHLDNYRKQLQSDYTKKMQKIAAERKKIEAYESFMANPVANIQQLATQYGLTLQQAAQVQKQQQEAWEPQTWEDVLSQAEERAEKRVMQKLGPFFQNVQKMRATSIEKQLDEIDPEWRTYEEAMREELEQHPTLSADPAKLYRLAVPSEILESRAVQKALKKFEAKQKSSQVTGKSETSNSAPAMPDIRGMSNSDAFNAAVQAAREKIAKMGR